MERKKIEVDSLNIRKEEHTGKEGEMKIFCPRTSARSSAIASQDQNDGLSKVLEINRGNVLRGIIFSEILNLPRSRRRR